MNQNFYLVGFYLIEILMYNITLPVVMENKPCLCKGLWNVKGVLRGIQIPFVCCLRIKVFSWFSREGMVTKKRVRITDLNFWLWIWLLLLNRYRMTRRSLSSSLHSPILTRTVVRLLVWNEWTEHSFKLKVKWSFETTECIHLMEGQVWPQGHLKSKSLC